MKVNRIEVRKEIEQIIADGVMDGEEVDITATNIMEVLELLIRAAEASQVLTPPPTQKGRRRKLTTNRI